MKQGKNKYKHYKRKTAAQKEYKIKFTTRYSTLEDYFSNPANTENFKQAAEQATKKQLEKGVPVVRIEDDIVYKFYPDGSKQRIASSKRRLHKLPQNRFYIQK